jgi:polygalacturonase
MRRDRRKLLTRLTGAGLVSALGAPASALGQAIPSGEAVADVRRFGAKGDGVTIDSPAINRAIDHAAARGGGTVYLPAGTYASYTIRLKSNITLHLGEGATLLAAPTPYEGLTSGGYDAADPPTPYSPYQDWGHNNWRNSLIWGENLHDIAIVGPGLIWGKGLSRGYPNQTDLPNSRKPGVGDKAIALKLCHNVLLRDFKVLQGGWFALLATGVDNLTIDNLIVDTNRDGFDIDCCRNVRVSRCTVNSPWDDGICPKSSFALGYARATENVTISDCYVTGDYQLGSVLDGSWKPMPADFSRYATGRIKCGTESNGGFKNITIANCVFDRSRGLALETVDGALCEDITVTNVAMRGAKSAPIFLRLGRRMRGPAGAQVGTLKRVLISNLTSSGGVAMPLIVAGVEGHPVEDVQIRDVVINHLGAGTPAQARRDPPERADQYPEPDMFGDLPAKGVFARHVRNLDLSHIELTTDAPDARPAFWLADVDGAEVFDARIPPGPAFDLRDVARFRNFGGSTLADVREAGPVTKAW